MNTDRAHHVLLEAVINLVNPYSVSVLREVERILNQVVPHEPGDVHVPLHVLGEPEIIFNVQIDVSHYSSVTSSVKVMSSSITPVQMGSRSMKPYCDSSSSRCVQSTAKPGTSV